MSAEKSVIFIVEDDAAFNKLISTYIKTKSEYEVYSYLSGEDCLEKIHKKPERKNPDGPEKFSKKI